MTRSGKFFAQGADGENDDPLKPGSLQDPDVDNSVAGNGNLNMLWLLLVVALLLLAGFAAYKRRQAGDGNDGKATDLGEVVQMDTYVPDEHFSALSALERHAASKPIRLFPGSVRSLDGHGRGGAIGNDIYGDLANSANNHRAGALGNATYGDVVADGGERVLANQTYQTVEPDDGPRILANGTYADVEAHTARSSEPLVFPGALPPDALYADGLPRSLSGASEPEYGSLNPAMSDAEYAEVSGIEETSIDLAGRGSSTAWGVNPRLMAGLRNGSYAVAVDDHNPHAARVNDEEGEEDTYGVVQQMKTDSSGSNVPRMTHYNMGGEELYQSNASVRGQQQQQQQQHRAPSSRSSQASRMIKRQHTVMPSPPIIYMVAENSQGGVGQSVKCEHIADEGGYVDMASGDLFVVNPEAKAAASRGGGGGGGGGGPSASSPSPQEYVASFSAPRDMDDETFLIFLPSQNQEGSLPLVQTTRENPTRFLRIPVHSRASRASAQMPFEPRRFSSAGSAKSKRGSPPLSIRVMSVRRQNPLHQASDSPSIDYSADPTAAPAALRPVGSPAAVEYAAPDDGAAPAVAASGQSSTTSTHELWAPSSGSAFFPDNLVIEDDQPGYYSSHHGDTMSMDVPLSPSFLPGQARSGRRNSGAIPLRSSSTMSYGGDADPLSADEEARAMRRTPSTASMLSAV